MSLRTRLKIYWPIISVLGGLVLAVVMLQNELAYKIFNVLFIGYFFVIGGLAVLGLAQITKSVAKGHYFNRNYGLSLMLMGAGWLLMEWYSLFKVDWIQSLISSLTGILLLIVSAWSLNQTSKDVRNYQG